MKNIKKPILLSPVANYEMLIAAIDGGADAVYLGVKGQNMRESAKNFSIKDLKKISKIAHDSKVKVYLTLNTICFDEEINKIKKTLISAKKAKIDAIISWDLGVIKLAKEQKLEVHLSTQASASNSIAISEYKKLGIKRFVLARECSLNQIKKIIKNTNTEIEIFIHGAMCVAVSGRCFLSHFLYGQSANKGKCIQPCRREYIATDIETNKQLEIHNNFILSPKDLCALPFLEKILDLNICALKIEGRGKSPEYVKIVTSVYREAIDLYFEKKLTSKKKEELFEKLKTVYNRDFSDGFYLGRPINEWADTRGSKATKTKTRIGKVTNYFRKIDVAEIKIEARSLKINDNILIIGPTTGVLEEKIKEIQLSKNNFTKIAKKGDLVAIKVKKRVRRNDEIYLYG